jgi:hypothetical protein
MTMSGLTSDPALHAALGSIYEEVMWLAKRPNVTPGRARAWYTHIMAESVKRRVRRFSGYVSVKAAEGPTEPLMLEHYKRIQTTLSALVERHRTSGLHDPEEFIATLLDYEHVHIVTRSENYAAMRAKGNYEQAGIRLQSWQMLPLARRQALWTSMLKGKVANAAAYFYGDEA